MSQINKLISTLKQQLKVKGKTYADIAQYLKVSESSIKRLFYTHGFSLKRLEAICLFIGLELTDLIQLVDANTDRITHLSAEQEQQIVDKPLLTIITISVLNGWSFKDIIHYYDITDNQCYQHLVTLEQLRIIELLPLNKFKVLVAQNFAWIPNDPIEQYFHQHMRQDFFDSTFTKTNEMFYCLNGMLSNSDNQLLQKKLQQLKMTFAELYHNSVKGGLDQADGSALVVALRPWRPTRFEQYKRKR